MNYSRRNLLCSALLVTCLTTPVLAQEVVVVDFAADQGPVTHRATGFIGADITNTTPSDDLLLPLKPQLLSWILDYRAADRATTYGIKYQVKLWKKGFIPSSASGDWSDWENYVRSTVATALRDNYHTVRYDIWNEPEFSTYWDGPIDERYWEMWRRAYLTIKDEDPQALVAGPSTTMYSWLFNTFLPWAQTNNVLPDVLTWHEMNDGSNVATRIQDMRDFLTAEQMNVSHISINEYCSSGYAKKPGVLVRFFSIFEKTQVHSAAKACWQEGGDWNCAQHLDNLVTLNQEKRSAWWTYKSYADISGNMVSVTESPNVKGVAGRDTDLGSAVVLLGSIGSTSDVELQAVNVPSIGLPGVSVRVIAEYIPNTEATPLAAPVEVLNESFLVVNGSVTIPLSSFGQYDAYVIRLSAEEGIIFGDGFESGNIFTWDDY